MIEFFFKKQSFYFLRKFAIFSAENFRSNFRQFRFQNFDKKYTAFYCIWSYLLFDMYLLIFCEHQILHIGRWKKIWDNFCNSRKLKFWVTSYFFLIFKFRIELKIFIGCIYHTFYLFWVLKFICKKKCFGIFFKYSKFS